jgi:hypothetical protein
MRARGGFTSIVTLDAEAPTEISLGATQQPVQNIAASPSSEALWPRHFTLHYQRLAR